MGNKKFKERGNNWYRFFDRYLGIPIIFLLRFFHRKRIDHGERNTIAIQKTAAIGDCVLLTAIIADLKKKFPVVKIIFFCGKSNYEYVLTIPDVDEVILLPINNPFKAIRIIRRYHFNIFIDLGPWPRIDALLSFFSHAGYTIGFNVTGEYRHYLFDHAVNHSNEIHEINNFRNLFRVIGIHSNSIPKIKIIGKDKFVNPYKSYIIFHPWAGGVKSHLKEWPIENWIELAEKIIQLGYNILITGSQSDMDKSIKMISFIKNRDKIINIAGKLSFIDVMKIIKNSKLMICVNTGIMHIGAALDIPLIALHGPTSVKRWGPLGSKSIVIKSPLAGCEYLNLGFEYPKNPPDCMSAITVDKVFKETINLLKR
jgi:ADP-heptose:LPS heptosyltransferase